MSPPAAPDGGGPGRTAGTHGDLGRDLSGSGRLARGSGTRFSTLRLRSAGAPSPRVRAAADAPPPPPAGTAAEPAPASGSSGAPPDPPPARASPLRRLLRWFGLGRGAGPQT